MGSKVKKRLVILSDLWGEEKSDWLINYTKNLKATFDIQYYDCCELGEINKSEYTEDNLHKQFIQGGIEKAIEKLVKKEKDRVTILAFSIGGTIAWKFGIKSNKIDNLICVSSTRLRHEIIKPEGSISVYFGADDKFIPSTSWLESMAIKYQILSDKEHLLYTEPEFAQWLSKKLVKTALQ